MRIQFTIPGPPVAFLAQYDKSKWSTKRRYSLYCDGVRAAAMVAGYRHGPVTRERPVSIYTRAFFADGRHPDPENVRKAIADALFYGQPGGDKYTGGAFCPPVYDKSNPRVEVVIVDGRKPLSKTIPEGW